MDDIWRMWAAQSGQYRQQPSEDPGSLTISSRMPEDTFAGERSIPGTMVVWSRTQKSSHDGAALNNMLLENSPKMHDITSICVTGYFKGEQHGWPDNDTAPSEQGAHQQQLQPCPMILHVPLNPALRLNMLTSELAQTGRGMPAVQAHAPKKQHTSRAFVLSLRGAGWKRAYPQEQYMAPRRTRPSNYYDIWDMAEDEDVRERDQVGSAAHASIMPAVPPRNMSLSHEQQQQILSRALTKISEWGTVEWKWWQTDSIRRAGQAALALAMRQNQHITGGQLKKAISTEAKRKASFLHQAQQREELAAQRRALPNESELSTVLAAANLPADGPGGMVAAQVHTQNQAAAVQHESSLLDRVVAQRSSTFPDAYRLNRAKRAGLVLTKEPHKGLTNIQVRGKEIEYLTNNGVLLAWATQKIDEIIDGLKQQLADGDSD